MQGTARKCLSGKGTLRLAPILLVPLQLLSPRDRTVTWEFADRGHLH